MGTLLLSRRSWSVHLVRGRPGGRFHVGSGGRPTESSTCNENGCSSKKKTGSSRDSSYLSGELELVHQQCLSTEDLAYNGCIKSARQGNNVGMYNCRRWRKLMAWCAGMLSGNFATCPNMALRPLVIWSDTCLNREMFSIPAITGLVNIKSQFANDFKTKTNIFFQNYLSKLIP